MTDLRSKYLGCSDYLNLTEGHKKSGMKNKKDSLKRIFKNSLSFSQILRSRNSRKEILCEKCVFKSLTPKHLIGVSFSIKLKAWNHFIIIYRWHITLETPNIATLMEITVSLFVIGIKIKSFSFFTRKVGFVCINFNFRIV